MRKGSANTARGAQRFIRETVGRVRRAGATGRLTVRADSGFWSRKVIGACVDHDVDFSITVRQTGRIPALIAAIDDNAWVDIDYTDRGQAQVAETVWRGSRLIVRRTKVTDDPNVLALFPDRRHHTFVTNRTGDAVALDADHRHHAVHELALRDLKQGVGLAHCPSGVFTANAAWLVAVALANNLLRWVTILGLDTDALPVAKTLRRRLLTLPGRMVRSARQTTLRFPTSWPWAEQFLAAPHQLPALPAPT